MLSDLPVFGICGCSGSGKTTLIEKLIPLLTARGLKVCVVKHDVHGFNVDFTGKDSDRFFRAGADVLLQGQEEEFFRVHSSYEHELSRTLISISRRYDVVLVEGHKDTPVTKVWLLSEREKHPFHGIREIAATLPRDTDRIGKVMSIFDDWLPRQWMRTPVFGCVLIGGKSTRMGTPKHLLFENGRTWLEKITDMLKQVTHQVVIAGDGTVPENLTDIVRLADVPGIYGPMAGILSAMRWAPHASWLVVACDLQNISPEALQWLLSTRKPGVWASFPRVIESGDVEPLLAHYDFRSHILLEKLAEKGVFMPAQIVKNPKVNKISPPDHLTAAWTNINTKT